MKIQKTRTSKISLQLRYDYYESFCAWVRCIHSDINWADKDQEAEAMLHFVILTGLLNRLSKSIYYPFKDVAQRTEKVRIQLEMDEAILLFKYLPGISTDPLVGFLNRELHKIIFN